MKEYKSIETESPSTLAVQITDETNVHGFQLVSIFTYQIPVTAQKALSQHWVAFLVREKPSR
jgi:hypothetical protein